MPRDTAAGGLLFGADGILLYAAGITHDWTCRMPEHWLTKTSDGAARGRR